MTDTLIDSLCAILYPIAWVEESTQEKHREDMRKTARSALAILPNSGEISDIASLRQIILNLIEAHSTLYGSIPSQDDAALRLSHSQRQRLIAALHIVDASPKREQGEISGNNANDALIKVLKKLHSWVTQEATQPEPVAQEWVKHHIEEALSFAHLQKREQDEVSANDNALFNILGDIKEYLLADKKEPALGRLNYALLHITKPIQNKFFLTRIEEATPALAEGNFTLKDLEQAYDAGWNDNESGFNGHDFDRYVKDNQIEDGKGK